jgi:hypothetical protein
MKAPGVKNWLETLVHHAIPAKFGLRHFRHLYEKLVNPTRLLPGLREQDFSGFYMLPTRQAVKY